VLNAIVAVEYPSPRAILEMVSAPEYAALNGVRVVAHECAELVATAVRS
jgi:hypothetical protein